MKIPTKFELNTEDFKIYFDNNKKTHVCESIETGEKTNIGVLGILMQMGILKPLEEDRKTDVRLSILSERVESLEKKLDDVLKNLTAPEAKIQERKDVIIEEREEKEDTLAEELKEPEIKKRIMEKVLEESLPEEEPEEIEEKETLSQKEENKQKPTEEKPNEMKIPEKTQEVEIEVAPEKSSDVIVESKEEIDNWMDI